MSKMTGLVLSGVIALSLVVPAVSLAQTDVDTSGGVSCAIISVNLRYHSTDATTGGAVSVLQDFLNSRGYLSSQPTGFFGSLTRDAAAAFQKANGISATPPGFVGPLTRAKIQQIDCNDGSKPTMPPQPVSQGNLYIEPANPSVQVGQTVQVKALYQPPMPPCPAGVFCAQVMPAPIVVNANWTSSNSNVAAVNKIYGDCAAPAPGTICTPPSPVTMISGASSGTATIKAAYSLSGAMLTATTNITVTSGTTQPSITLTYPNGGEQYQPGAPITFYWTQNYGSVDLQVHLFDSNSGKEYYRGPISGSIGKNGNSLQGEDVKVPAGMYRITICDEGTPNPAVTFKPLCDSSDAPFSIGAGTTQPSCTLTTHKSSYQLGEPIVFSWTSQNATYAAFQQDIYGKDTIWLPGDKMDISGSYSATASVIGNPRMTLLIYNYSGSSSCSVTVPIVAGTSAPTISYLNPTSATVGSTISVYGTNFSLNSFVALDGDSGPSVTPTVHSSTRLAFVLPSSLTVGTHSVQVGEKAGNLPLSNPAPLTIISAPHQTASALDGLNGLTPNTTGPQPDASFTYVWNTNLQIGSPYFADVQALQTALTKEGMYTGEITGGFYNQTLAGVQSFQQKYGIEATGYVGSITRAKLNSLYAN